MSSTLAVNEESKLAESWAQRVQRDFVRNVLAAVLFDATWAVGMSFAMASVLMPSYLRELDSPRVIIGITTSLPVLVVPLMLFSDSLLGGRKRRRNAFLCYIVCSFCFLAYGLFALAAPEEWRWPRIVGFMFSMAIMWAAIVLSQPLYFAILTDNCPIRRRGKLFAFRITAVGLTGLMCLWLIRPWMSRYSGAHGYHVAITMSGVCYLISCLSILLWRDNIDPTRPDPTGAVGPRMLMRHALGNLRDLWLTPNYRVFIFFAVMVSAASTLGPYLITYSGDILGVTADLPTRFQAVTFAAHIFNGMFVGVVADRWGYRMTLLLLGVAGVAAYSIAQSAGSIHAVMLAYALNVLLTSSMGVVLCNLSVELMPGRSTADLIAAANLFALPASTLTPWICGSVLDAAKAAGVAATGYHVVFTVSLVLALVGALGTAILVQEPRTGRVYVIKVLERS